MILAEKITQLRKRAGWSQEELAQQLDVTRQSVSKWESAQSVPDMERLLRMSRLFGVTTDYLLKDELEETPQTTESAQDSPLRRVTMQEASDYLTLRRAAAPKLALAVFLCVISPIALIFLAGLSEAPAAPITENAAAGIGLCILLCLIAVAVSIFIRCGAKTKAYEYLEKEPFETEYGVDGMARQKRDAFSQTATSLNVAATALCILSAVPLFAAIGFKTQSDFFYVAAVCLRLLLAACGAALFTYCGTIASSVNKLLEEGDYTRANKKESGIVGAIATCYWLVSTAIYLVLLLGPWKSATVENSWIVWPVAGVLFAALMCVLKIAVRKNED